MITLFFNYWNETIICKIIIVIIIIIIIIIIILDKLFLIFLK